MHLPAGDAALPHPLVTGGHGAVTFDVFEGMDALEALSGDWERLFQATGAEPSSLLEWTRALSRHLVDEGCPRFLVRLQRGARTVGLVPLVGRTSHVLRQRCLILLPASEIANTHSDLLVERSGEAVGAFLSAIGSLDVRWDGLRLGKLLDTNPLIALLEQRSRSAGWLCRTRFSRASYHLALPAAFGDYLATRSAKFRNYAKRMEKKLRAAGQIQVTEVRRPADVSSGLDAVLHIERSSWKELHGTSMHARPHQAAFYREWGHAAAAAGRLHLLILTLNGEPVAYDLGCVDRGCYYYLKTSHHARYRPFSPATYLRLRLVERLIGMNVATLDFIGTPFQWERQWTETYRWQRVVSIYPDTLRGRVLARLDRWTHRSESGRAVEHADPREQRPLQERSGRRRRP